MNKSYNKKAYISEKYRKYRLEKMQKESILQMDIIKLQSLTARFRQTISKCWSDDQVYLQPVMDTEPL